MKMNNIIDCKSIRDKYIEKIKRKKITGCTVAFIQVGNNSASCTYVRNKKRLCEEVGINVEHYHLCANTSQNELLAIIKKLNDNVNITGIMVQLPLQEHISEEIIINAINPSKDIDGFHIKNKGKVVVGDKSGIIAATPRGIMTILEEEKINLEGKNVVIVGRSNIVGKPLSSLLINAGATVTVCNSKTDKKYLVELIHKSDIFISAIGQANYFNKELLNGYLENTIAIDVGINRDNEGKLCGDIDKELYPYFKRVTSVPGGVGLTTQMAVVSNIVDLYKSN